MSEPFLGEIKMVGFNFAPRGWALCEGQLLPISQNTALFSLLGTTFGGDGRTTFGLPDMRGRSARGVGSGPGLRHISWGDRGGSNQLTLNTSHMPSHNHLVKTNSSATQDNESSLPSNQYLGDTNTGATKLYASNTDGTTLNTQSVTNTGGNAPMYIDNPFLGIYHAIALTGIYPSRN